MLASFMSVAALSFGTSWGYTKEPSFAPAVHLGLRGSGIFGDSLGVALVALSDSVFVAFRVGKKWPFEGLQSSQTQQASLFSIVWEFPKVRGPTNTCTHQQKPTCKMYELK